MAHQKEHSTTRNDTKRPRTNSFVAGACTKTAVVAAPDIDRDYGSTSSNNKPLHPPHKRTRAYTRPRCLRDPKSSAAVVRSLGLPRQFAALCTVAHPRCGWARPELRQISISGPCNDNYGLAARLVWEFVTLPGTVRFFSVSVMSGLRRWSNLKSTAFTFGVSMLTHGIVSGTRCCWLHCDSPGVSGLLGGNRTHFVARNWTLGDAVFHSWKTSALSGMFPVANRGIGDSSVCQDHGTKLVFVSQSGDEDMGDPLPRHLRRLIRTCDWKDDVQLVYRADAGYRFPYTMNHKWCVVCGPGSQLAVSNLLHLDRLRDWQIQAQVSALDEDAQSVAETLILPEHHGGFFRPIAVFMTKTHEDEAVLVYNGVNYESIELVVINLEPFCRTKSLTEPVNYTTCSLPAVCTTQCRSISMVLVLQTESKEPAFIVKVECSRETEVILQFRASAGPKAVGIARFHRDEEQGLPALDQMNERQYCVTQCPNTLTIWDCDNPTQPLRIVDHSAACCGLVFGHSGFLFHVRGNSITVTDDSPDGRGPGAKIAMLLPCGQRNHHRITSLFSYLCCD